MPVLPERELTPELEAQLKTANDRAANLELRAIRAETELVSLRATQKTRR